jgi:tryptophan synthase alpha chain
MASGPEQIEAAFAAARTEGRAALMPYMMGCYPAPEAAAAIAAAYAEGGADLVELGIPYSDPLADGPVIHAAATAALAGGATLERALGARESLGERPTVVMCYSNMILARGADAFAVRMENAGVAGVIVPDLPLEEAERFRGGFEARGLALVPLVAPTTPAERRRRIAAAASGFIYAVSDVGVTGEREQLPSRLTEFVSALKGEASVPVAVGFGIGTPEQAAAVGEIADGVIIGSRLVRAAEDADKGPAEVREFLGACRALM